MSITTMVGLLRGGVLHVFMLAGPVLGAALLIGLIIAIFQATTSIQEQTLTFLPKVLVMLLIIALLGKWMLAEMGQYTITLFNMIPELVK